MAEAAIVKSPAVAEMTSTCADTKAETCSSSQNKYVNGTICHVEFTTPDFAKAAKTYGELFGWQFHPMSENEMYFQTPENYGPCGCINLGTASADAKTMIYVHVDCIGTTIEKASKIGATVKTPKTEIPGGHGHFAQIKMPDGNIFGIYTPPKSKM